MEYATKQLTEKAYDKLEHQEVYEHELEKVEDLLVYEKEEHHLEKIYQDHEQF